MSDVHRVVVCDDHAIFREGIKQVLAANPRLEVVGEAANGLEALEQVVREAKKGFEAPAKPTR